ncbi:YsnF/AvaK domain-containing protein [Caldimonas tepidiphila]|uniref:YsnF/AvaK domain-containing protein n=1 Tax=Caldimonas tepidiphila TaxID=2315841 RepID=UPI0013002EEA|nr:YsnF/AvaK domain-containing protein [Caldimonas tepidiphila]
MKQTIVGAFEQYSSAQRAADLLASRGIARDHIRLQTASDSTDSGYRATSDVAEDRGVMASVRNFFSDVFGPDRDHEDIYQYNETVKRGGTVLAVDVDDSDRMPVTEVCQELKNAGAIDLDQRASEWRASGWKDSAGESRTAETSMRRDTGRVSGEQIIPVVQENIDIGKRVVEQGGIRVYTHVVEQPVRESVDLRSEKAVVERRPVDRPLSNADDAFQDRTIEVRESAEKAVVSKTARVVEEVRVGKEVQHQTQEIKDTVRHTEVDVQRMGGGMEAGGVEGELVQRDLGNEVHALEYREHWNRNYAKKGGRYEDYDPAYRYGHTLANDARYRDRDWSAIEPDVRRDWEARNPGGTWDGMKASVRHAWERAKR